MKLNPCLCSARGLLHAFHSTKDFSWNRQIIKGKAVTTAANLQEYIKTEFTWRANGAPTVEEFQQFNRLIYSTGKSWILGRVRCTLLQGLLTSRSHLSAQTCTCGPSVNRVMRGHKITVLHQLEDPAPAVLEVARKPYIYSKKKHPP